MSPRLRPLQLPLQVERGLQEAAQGETAESEISHSGLFMVDSSSSDVTSPVTPTFSPHHLRCSSSMSSFELGTPATVDSPSSPNLAAQPANKRILDNVEEEPFQYGDLEDDDDDDESDVESYHFDLYDCLCDEPCIHKDNDLMQSTSNFYGRGREVDYDLSCLSDSDSTSGPHMGKKPRDGSISPFAGFSHRLGSRFPVLNKWKSKKPRSVHSPVSDFAFEPRLSFSRAPSSRSSSLSASARHLMDRLNEPLPPTPALSSYESSDNVTSPGPLDVEEASHLLVSIQRERAQATTPLLPPMMTSVPKDYLSAKQQPSPLEPPAVACLADVETRSPSPVMSPPLSSRPSISSFRQIQPSVDLPFPEPDAWSDILGHANFTIVPQPYLPEVADLASLRQLRADWETARVNYTKHLVRTGEHYGITSKTYEHTEAKWAETAEIWRGFHDELVDAVVASGEATDCEKFDECVLTTVPRMDAEGKFPERGDVDIVGPMVREATMSSLDGADRKRSGFWRNLTGRVGLRK
ncbi:hypothetical protein F4809DRAFT_507024 [Biscogniauxia mediterranea]|nr:hypothetical protein F4809DRAFT_507024 [Biscogniauxia mediterranea]